jgi:hypothetical protein
MTADVSLLSCSWCHCLLRMRQIRLSEAAVRSGGRRSVSGGDDVTREEAVLPFDEVILSAHSCCWAMS